MKHSNILFSILTIVFASSFLPLSGQSNVTKVSALKTNDYGVTYTLPKTALEIEAAVTKITLKAGPYSKYAEKYLGITSNVAFEDQVYYTLDKVSVVSKGIPNKDESYLIEFKSKTTAPFVYLTKDGMICTINAEYEPAQDKVETQKSAPDAGTKVSAQSAYTEEYLRAGSVSKMAEVAAKQIYKLRESRMDILTGDSENAPRDGEAMKIVLQQLEAQEKALVELFTGTTIQKTETARFEMEPKADLEKEVVFRFSKYLGIVRNDDLSGAPIYLNLKKLDMQAEAPIDPKAKKEKEKDPKAIVYNLPGKASVEIYYGTQEMYRGDVQVVQFGTTQTLATSIFEDKKAAVKVYFYPETGAIKQIIQ